MRRIALVAEQGLHTAMDEITAFATQPMDVESLRILRVALAIVEDEYAHAEYLVLQALWDQGKHGILSHLMDNLVAVGVAMREPLHTAPLSRMSRRFVEELLHTTTDLMRIINTLHIAYPPTSRSVRILSETIAQIFTYANALEPFRSPSRSLSVIASRSRQTCLDLLRSLSVASPCSGQSKPIAEIVLRTLLEHATRMNAHDPIHHLPHVYSFIDHVLPGPASDPEERVYWVTSIIPSMLPEMRTFFRVLDTHTRAQFIKRLVKIDDGVAGIGEWILLQEFQRICQTLQSLNDTIDEKLRAFGEHEVMLSLRLLSQLASPSCLQSWLVDSVANHAEMSQLLVQIMEYCLDFNVSSEALSRLTRFLALNCSAFDPRLRYIIAISQLRSAQGLANLKSMTDLASISLDILQQLPADFIDTNRLTVEVGHTLAEIVSSNSVLESLEAETSEVLLLLLDWVTGLCLPDSTTLMMTDSSFAQLCTCMQRVLRPEMVTVLQSVQSRIMFEWRDSSLPPIRTFAEMIQMSVEDLQILLSPPAPMPSTPRRNTPDLLSLVTISPPTAVLRSPAATGLTKTYSNNDFRQLRQLPSARQNTSRLPSMHVDVGINGMIHLT